MFPRAPIVVALIGAAAIATHAQRGRFDVQDVGLTPLNVGEVIDTSMAPGSPASRAKAVVRAAIRDDARSGAAQTAAPGRVIVRFRAAAGAAARAAAVRAVTRSGMIAQRPSYADFDLIRMDSADDPEAVAAALKAQHADVVENAQAAYRWKTMFKPNDPLYATRQWNFPYVNLEPAWDIQPAAGSDITVAVIDSGMAFRSASFTTNIPAFSVGTLVYPALNNVTIPFAAADQLVNASTAEPDRRPVRLHLGRRPPARLRGPRHARRRHHRPDYERQHRAGRGRLQRQADADQGDRRRVGSPAGLAELRDRRPGRARDTVRGGSRREDPEHEHRADRPAVVRDRGRDPLCRRPGRLRGDRCRKRVPGRQSAVGARGNLLADQRRDVRGRDRSQQRARLVFDGRRLRRNLRAGRRRQHAGLQRHRQLHRPADLRLQFHRHVSAAAVTVSAAAVRRAWVTSVTRGRRWRRRTLPGPRRS